MRSDDDEDDELTPTTTDVVGDEPSINDLAEAGYLGYADHTGGKTFDGREMPSWTQLPERIRAAWAAAAGAIRRHLRVG